MTLPDDAIELRLNRLRVQTDGIAPSAGFEAKLLVLLAATPANDALSQVWRWGKFGVALGAVVAAASVVLALSQSVTEEQEDALSYGTVEYFE
ncbi:MAG: hypothetical protein QM784_12840 [Polyangiaceae bacterium]